MPKVLTLALLLLAFVVCSVSEVRAQTTAFTYQGSLKDGASPANGNYDFEFALYDASSAGSQIGTTIPRNGVAVANGIFSVKLDFGPEFPGADRFLEIRVRLAGQPGITTLAPRQLVNSAPYSVKSLNTETATNATQLGGVAANQYVVSTDPRMTDARPPTAGSANYIQNTTSPQPSSSFIISGTGTANIFNASAQFNLNGSRVLSNAGTQNLFAGLGAGQVNTGISNSFFGGSAGQNNSGGADNSFFGFAAGFANISGGQNSFFGRGAGQLNHGNRNSFFGTAAGSFNNTGADNSFFGHNAGNQGTAGNNNAFFGVSAGLANTASNNSFFGSEAGVTNTGGGLNTTLGRSADVLTGNLTNATAIGALAAVGASNSLVLGSISGVNGATANTNVGIGTTTPSWKLHVAGTGIQRAAVRSDINAGFILGLGNTDRWSLATTVANGNFLLFNEINATVAISVDTNSNAVAIPALGAAGATALCRNALNQISTCSSSLRYKTDIGRFSPGMSFVNQLRPISFDWKDGGMKDVGFGAEDVAKIDPRFVTYNDKGEVEGVKYDRLSVAFVNAFKELQQRIEQQQKQIEAQQNEMAKRNVTEGKLQSQIDDLKKIVCSLKRNADGCKLEEK